MRENGVGKVLDLPDVARFYQVLGNLLLRLLRAHPRVLSCNLGHVALLVKGLNDRELVLLLPRNVLLVAKGAEVDNASAELHVNRVVFQDWHLLAEYRHLRLLADELLVPLVLRMHEYRNAGRHHLRTRCSDCKFVSLAVQVDVVEFPRSFDVADLGLCKGCLALRAPEDRMLLPVEQLLLVEVQQGALDQGLVGVVHGLVGVIPVCGIADIIELLPHPFDGGLCPVLARLEEFLLVLLLDPDLFLYSQFCRQSMAVEALRQVDLKAPHSLVSGNEVNPDVVVDMAHVQRSRGEGWWGVYGIDFLPGAWVKAVGLLLLPAFLPLRLYVLRIVALVHDAGKSIGIDI